MIQVLLPLLLLALSGSFEWFAIRQPAHHQPGEMMQAQAPKPQSYPFDQYPAGKVYRGQAAPPKLITAEQRAYRTVLRQGAKKGPNFAGHFTVVEWGCGSNCIAMAVVDAVTGVVYDQDMPGMNQSGTCGPVFRVTSTLFVVETSYVPNGDCKPEMYRWDGSHFVEVSEP